MITPPICSRVGLSSQLRRGDRFLSAKELQCQSKGIRRRKKAWKGPLTVVVAVTIFRAFGKLSPHPTGKSKFRTRRTAAAPGQNSLLGRRTVGRAFFPTLTPLLAFLFFSSFFLELKSIPRPRPTRAECTNFYSSAFHTPTTLELSHFHNYDSLSLSHRSQQPLHCKTEFPIDNFAK